MRRTSIVVALAIAASLSACQRSPSASHTTPPPAPLAAPGEEIAWRHGDVDDALAEAKESGKPVLLYWGAVWCPPCNQLKTTLFKDRAFVGETRNFVPVYLDGDTDGAQRWGERFGISGYPTMIVLRPDGSEVTRLSTGARLPEVLRVAAVRTSSIDDLLAKAAKNPSALSQDEWQLLAAYDWHNDPKRLSDSAQTAARLERLSKAAPEGPIKRRFALLALVIGIETGPDGKYALSATEATQVGQVVPEILKHGDEVITNRQELSYATAPLIAALPDARQRTGLGQSLIKALDRVYNDKNLPLPDRLATVNADIALDGDAGKTASPAVLAKVRERAAWADKEAKDAMVRQSVISNAAGLLHEAGDTAGAKALLEAELKRSASPYYYMLDLASLAEEANQGPAAIAWARKAYETSEGSATRVQWAIAYSNTVLRQAPDDAGQVEASAQAVIDELGKNSGNYYQRTRVKVGAWGGQLREWSKTHNGKAVLKRLDTRMATVCEKQGEAAATCRKWGQTT
jgi:protein disulfide-isomerase